MQTLLETIMVTPHMQVFTTLTPSDINLTSSKGF